MILTLEDIHKITSTVRYFPVSLTLLMVLILFFVAEPQIIRKETVCHKEVGTVPFFR